MTNSHTDALRAYLNLLEKNATKRADLSLKEHFAQQLISNLRSDPLTPALYRVAVDATLESLPEEYKKDAVLVARELFPFLMSDVKTVVAMMRTGGYRGFSQGNSVIAEKNIKSMRDLMTMSAGQIYSSQQSASYDNYLASLRAIGTGESSIAMRARISKALLYLHRDKEVTPRQYRSAVDSVMPLLATEEAQLFFVLVAREFYHFLTMDPDAQSRINAGASYKSGDLFG